MLQKSGCTLRHLTLHSIGGERGPFGTINAVNSFIRRCVLVWELSILGIRVCTESITGLLRSLESVRQLRVLALDISYVRDLHTTTVADGILEFLESRRRPTDTSSMDLESFTLHAPSAEEVFGFTDVQCQRVKALRASGLLLYICQYAENDPRMY